MLTLQVDRGILVAKSNHELPALKLLIEIELEDGSQDSLLRALDYRREYCKREQANLNQHLYTIESGALGLGPVVWYRPGTYMPALWMNKKDKLEHIEVGPLQVSRCLARNLF